MTGPLAVLFVGATLCAPAVQAHHVDGQPTPRTFTRQAIEAGAPAPDGPGFVRPTAVTTLRGPGTVEFLVTTHRAPDVPEDLHFWRREGDRYRHLRSIVGAEDPEIGGFDAPTPFAYQGRMFVHVQLQYTGTGGIHEDFVFHLSPAGALEPVEFVDAATWFQPRLRKGEGVWKGVFYAFADDTLPFQFSIWNDGDGNCCPTAGRVTGRYTITAVTPVAGASKDTYRWRLVPATFTRHPPEPRG